MSLTLSEKKEGFLSGNELKILAALFMICDHVGMLFFPVLFPPMGYLRYIGRVAYPIFAFFIAEGCRYTKNKSRYLGTLAFLGLAFHLVYYYATKDETINVIVSFALAVGVIYLWQFLIDFIKEKKYGNAALIAVFSAAYLFLCYLLCQRTHIDYYFGGIFLPWFVYLTKRKWLRLFFFAVGITIVVYCMGEFAPVERWGLLAVPIMALYSGKRGEWKMKYFFYVFYPAHLVLLYGISLFVLGGKQ